MTSTELNNTTPPKWAVVTLALAGAYNLLWGAIVIVFPLAFFQWLSLPLPTYPQIWQCVGMVVGVYGVGYLIAARDPARHWPIVLVGLLGKVFGPIGFIWAVSQGELPWQFGLMILLNDLPWWIPFTGMLIHAYRVHSDTSSAVERLSFVDAISTIESHRGATLEQLSWQKPLLILFLRHSGCTFCREALSDLAAQREEIEAEGVELAIVHLDSPRDGADATRRNGLDDVHRFTDRQCQLYEAFGLQRGRFLQLAGPKVMLRAWPALLLGGHGFGRVRGDGFRMPGVFILHEGKIVAEYRHRTAGDRPNYSALAKEAIADASEPAATI